MPHWKGFDPAEILAISSLKSPNVREQVEEGEYEIDVYLRLVGVLKVGRDHPATIPAAIPWQRIASVALSKVNAQTADAIVREAIADDYVADEAVNARAKTIVGELVESTTTTRKGRVTLEAVVNRPMVKVPAERAVEIEAEETA